MPKRSGGGRHSGESKKLVFIVELKRDLTFLKFPLLAPPPLMGRGYMYNKKISLTSISRNLQ